MEHHLALLLLLGAGSCFAGTNGGGVERSGQSINQRTSRLPQSSPTTTQPHARPALGTSMVELRAASSLALAVIGTSMDRIDSFRSRPSPWPSMLIWRSPVGLSPPPPSSRPPLLLPLPLPPPTSLPLPLLPPDRPPPVAEAFGGDSLCRVRVQRITVNPIAEQVPSAHSHDTNATTQNIAAAVAAIKHQ